LELLFKKIFGLTFVVAIDQMIVLFDDMGVQSLPVYHGKRGATTVNYFEQSHFIINVVVVLISFLIWVVHLGFR